MKIKAFGVAFGIIWALMVGWAIILAMLGKGMAPYNLFDQFYLGWLNVNAIGLVYGVILAFIDGFVGGAIFAWIYNKIS